jgi:hypothetical protein
MSELAQDPPHRVDAGRPVRHVGRTQPVERRERLLLERLHRDRVDRLVPSCLENRHRVGAVRLVAVAVACYVGGRQQPHPVTERREVATPVVRRAARLH